MKSIFASKTFWLNILGAATMVVSSGVVPVKYSAPVLALLNIGNRFLTSTSVSVPAG